jgi:hypothetical protein
MWEKIVEVLLNKYFKTSEQKEEKLVKEKIVFLHEALVHCHNAYLQYKSKRSEENFVVWRRSVGYLIRVLEEVRTTLASFAPEAYDHAVDYAITEIPLIPPGISETESRSGTGRHSRQPTTSRERSKTFINNEGDIGELEILLEKLKGLKKRQPPQKVGKDFEEATARLREFMRVNMTMGQIHRAQKAFKEEIMP